MSPNAAASANVPHCALPPTERSHSCPASLLAVREPIMMWWPIVTSLVAMAVPTMPVPSTAIFIIASLSLGFEVLVFIRCVVVSSNRTGDKRNACGDCLDTPHTLHVVVIEHLLTSALLLVCQSFAPAMIHHGM